MLGGEYYFANHLRAVKMEIAGKEGACTKDLWLSLSELRDILLQISGYLNTKSHLLGPSIISIYTIGDLDLFHTYIKFCFVKNRFGFYFDQS